MYLFHATTMKRLSTLLVVIAGLAGGSAAQAASVRLADEYQLALDIGEEKAKALGSNVVWLNSKRKEIVDYLQQYWSAPCDEAMVFAEPAMHAGELVLTVVCKRGERVEADRSIPERQQRAQHEVKVEAWDQFAENVMQWRVSGLVTGLEPTIEATLRAPDRAFLNTFNPLLAVYRGNHWFVLPMRVWETADIPRLERTRWEEAMIVLWSADRKKIDEQAEESRVRRGRSAEDLNLFEAVDERDIVKFKQAFDQLKYLQKNSYPVYQKLAEALAHDQDEMVIYALRSGTPARLAKDDITAPATMVRPALPAAMIDTYHCGTCPLKELQGYGFKMVTRWVEVVKKAQLAQDSSEADLQAIKEELEAAIIRNITQREQQRAASQCK